MEVAALQQEDQAMVTIRLIIVAALLMTAVFLVLPAFACDDNPPKRCVSKQVGNYVVTKCD